jgi:glycosyltransferase involved in cell wall biosynthesis
MKTHTNNLSKKMKTELQHLLQTLRLTQTAGELPSQYDIIVFSHLRWSFVIQRPQHIITRLARNRHVLFVEEPIDYDSENYGTANLIPINRSITVVQPRITWERIAEDLPLAVNAVSKRKKLTHPLLWFYSAAFAGVIPHIKHSLIIYDCMDELSLFKGASPTLIAQEKELLSRADIVFTGGKSLYESKHQYHPHVHCFPSSVDCKHFAKAGKRGTIIPEDLIKIPLPRVGYYGVIDERINLNLLDEVACQMPKVSFVMIGPLSKISQSELPMRPNIYYLGNKSYTLLPRYLKGIDVTWMPFALNAATKFISPTKTLEFRAAYKPIISTAISDVVRDYRTVVSIIHTGTEAVSAIKSYLQETKIAISARVKQQQQVIKKTSWDNTVLAMQRIVTHALVRRIQGAVINRKFLQLTRLPLQVAYD